jgi:4-hydroxyphenylacetate 3-monooxygenase/4-hydroxybutyryl-CoA dehydratase/vinylacetyl-CoA-Delta-isomerase
MASLAPSISEKSSRIFWNNRVSQCSGIASAVNAKKTASGTYIPESKFVNAGRRLAGENIFHEWEILCDVARGWYATLPFEQDWLNEEIEVILRNTLCEIPAFPPIISTVCSD